MELIWNIQTPDQICELYTECLISRADSQIAWEHWRGKSDGPTPDWHPGMFINSESSEHEYDTYFPAIINHGNDSRKVVTYKANREFAPFSMWLNLPRLDFLPMGVNDVIAGAGGLLCVNGSQQPTTENTSSEKDCKRFGKQPEQSLLLVCNPLTREVKYLPRQTTYHLRNKVARMVLDPSFDACCNTKRRIDYRLFVLGNCEERELPKLHPRSEIILLTFDSRADQWVAGMSANNARLPQHGKTDLAIVGDGLFLGGQVLAGYRKRWPGEPKEQVWENKVFWVVISQAKWNLIDFCIEDDDGRPVGVQAPIIVQCRAGGEVYAITRRSWKPRTIHIYQVMLLDDSPTGSLKLVSCMPEEIFYTLFEESVSLKRFECTAGMHYIAFLASFSSQQAVAVYDLLAEDWFLSYRPIDRGCLGRFSLVRCDWTPNFRAKP